MVSFPSEKQTRLTPVQYNKIQTKVTLVHVFVVLLLATALVIFLSFANWSLSKLIPSFSYQHSTSMIISIVVYILALVVYFVDKNNMDIMISRWMLSKNIGTGLYSL